MTDSFIILVVPPGARKKMRKWTEADHDAYWKSWQDMVHEEERKEQEVRDRKKVGEILETA